MKSPSAPDLHGIYIAEQTAGSSGNNDQKNDAGAGGSGIPPVPSTNDGNKNKPDENLEDEVPVAAGSRARAVCSVILESDGKN